jgi:hypothetical protein
MEIKPQRRIQRPGQGEALLGELDRVYPLMVLKDEFAHVLALGRSSLHGDSFTKDMLAEGQP